MKKFIPLSQLKLNKEEKKQIIGGKYVKMRYGINPGDPILE